VVRSFVDDRIEAIASAMLLAELELVLRRPKIQRYVDERGVCEYIQRVQRHATVVDDPPDTQQVTRDPKDDYLVALARHQRVDAVVSGDRDLLEAA
jgi:putative PIN family toxin of toxin-antitoxin system